MAKIENIELKRAFPYDALERLGVVAKAMDAMTPEERAAALVWLKSKHRAEWPSDSY